MAIRAEVPIDLVHILIALEATIIAEIFIRMFIAAVTIALVGNTVMLIAFVFVWL